MVTPDGGEFPMTGTYAEVAENRRLTIAMDVPGKPEPEKMTVDLTPESDDRTRLVVHQTCATTEERDMAEQGTTMLLDSLTAFLAG